MKTIQIEVSDQIYDTVIRFLGLLPENECHIVTNQQPQRQALREALENAVRLNVFADIADPQQWQRETRPDRPLPGRD